MSGRKTNRKICSLSIGTGLIAMGVLPVPSHASPAEVLVAELRELRFGQFAVIGSGQRTVDVNGSVSDRGLISTGSSTPGPAQFEVSYDRGHDSHTPISVVLELSINSDGVPTSDGLAKLTHWTSDIPGSRSLQPGQYIYLEMKNCRTRICKTEFKIGATLRLSRAMRGQEITVPTAVSVRVVDVY